MPEEITSQELEKASRNLERMAEFIGERRAWSVGAGGETIIHNAYETSASLARGISGLTDGRVESVSIVQQPPELQPSALISANRLSKFADFMEQLRCWFASHGDGGLPPESDDIVRSMLASLAITGEALQRLLASASLAKTSENESSAAVAESPAAPIQDASATANVPEIEASDEPAPPTGSDLGPVADVDRAARLILEDTKERPLLQKFQGVVELTVEAKEQLDGFLTQQGVELGKYETHRIHDKVLRWIEGTPGGNVLVIKITGLFGKPEAYSRYQPKEKKAESPDPDAAD